METQVLPEKLARFLNSGAFYRISQDQIMLAEGPWSADSESYQFATQDFFSTEVMFFRANQVLTLNRGDFLRFLEPALAQPRTLKSHHFIPADKAHFETSFQIIQGKIQRGEIEKAVPVVFSRATQTPIAIDRAHAIASLLASPTELHAFGFWNSNDGVIGGTPEILFHRKSMIVQTMALAGSMPKSEEHNRVSLLQDSKELREHELVVNDLVTKLKPLGWLKKYDTEVLELPTLYHLRTRLEVGGCSKRDLELIKLLHPTPALGVAPRAYGYSWMRDLPEQYDRELFGGPFLVRISADETIALVAIRSLFWSEKGSRIGTGCGIVSASELDREWAELAAKREAVFAALGLN